MTMSLAKAWVYGCLCHRIARATKQPAIIGLLAGRAGRVRKGFSRARTIRGAGLNANLRSDCVALYTRGHGRGYIGSKY